MKNHRPLFGLFFLAGLTIPHISIAQSYVATVSKYTSSSTSTISQTFSSASTTGNLIVVHFSWDNQSRKINTVVDNKGNTYHRINGPTNWYTNYRSELWYAYNITGGGAPVKITATLNGNSTSYFQIFMSEYSGISTSDPLDQHSVAAGHTATANSGAKTTLIAGELVYGVSIGSSGSLGGGATFSVRSTDNQNIVEDKIAATMGSYSTSFTSAGGDWVAEMATFKPLIILPLVLTDLSVRTTDANTVLITWATSMEVNNDYFDVQRSKDGSDWSTVKKIKGAGNSNSMLQYAATDSAPLPGLSYYRLSQFDLDGHARSSEWALVNIDPASGKKYRVYPNPAFQYLIVEGTGAGLQNISVINYTGQSMDNRIRLIRENDQKVMVDLSSLPGGIYFLKTKDQFTPFYKQ